jgi:hypothetical protein
MLYPRAPELASARRPTLVVSNCQADSNGLGYRVRYMYIDIKGGRSIDRRGTGFVLFHTRAAAIKPSSIAKGPARKDRVSSRSRTNKPARETKTIDSLERLVPRGLGSPSSMASRLPRDGSIIYDAQTKRVQTVSDGDDILYIKDVVSPIGPPFRFVDISLGSSVRAKNPLDHFPGGFVSTHTSQERSGCSVSLLVCLCPGR